MGPTVPLFGPIWPYQDIGSGHLYPHPTVRPPADAAPRARRGRGLISARIQRAKGSEAYSPDNLLLSHGAARSN